MNPGFVLLAATGAVLSAGAVIRNRHTGSMNGWIASTAIASSWLIAELLRSMQ